MTISLRFSLTTVERFRRLAWVLACLAWIPLVAQAEGGDERACGEPGSDTSAAEQSVAAAVPADGKLRVFILAGQSNMEGRGFPEPLAWQVSQKEYRGRWTRFVQDGDYEGFLASLEASKAASQQPEYRWSEREDVWIDYLGKHGNLTVGYGAPRDGFGPEFNFGQVLGDYYKDPVLIVKTSWGGRALARGFLPPSSMKSDVEFAKEVETLNEKNRLWNEQEKVRVEKHNERVARENAESGENKRLRKFKPRPDVSVEEYKSAFGRDYRNMLKAVRDCLDALEERFPNYQGQEPVIEGFVWFQGWNDQYEKRWLSYEDNLANLIRDVRQEFDAPEMRFVIGQMGHDGMKEDKPDSPRAFIKRAQAEVPKYPEFADTVVCVPTDQYWDMEADAIFRGPGGWKADVERWKQFGNDFPYHYYGSPWFFAQAGTGFGEAMVRLLQGQE